VIDVGVAFGTPQIYRAFPRAKYWLVEPVEEARPTLERLRIELDAECVFAAAGTENGEVELFVHDDLSGSSVLAQAEGALLDGTQRRVRRVRLDSVLPDRLDRPCLLKVDTQGTELDVLHGLGNRLAEMDVIIIETSLFPFRQGAPVLADVVRFMEDRALVVYDILEGEARALDGALAQVDLVFVPRDGPLRRDPRFFSAPQAEAYAARSRRQVVQSAVGR
jgi:FkbM family methyltransferase